MGAKKKAAKKAAKKRNSGTMVDAPAWTGRRGCSPDEICDFLEELSEWLKWFNADYKKLRKAVCNVEKKAWGLGGATTAKRFCSHGPGDEPADPQRPPVWF